MICQLINRLASKYYPFYPKLLDYDKKNSIRYQINSQNS